MRSAVWLEVSRSDTTFTNPAFILIMEAKEAPDPAMAKISAALDVKAGTEHRQDALNLLTYSFLLIITILFIWGFKHRRLRYEIKPYLR